MLRLTLVKYARNYATKPPQQPKYNYEGFDLFACFVLGFGVGYSVKS